MIELFNNFFGCRDDLCLVENFKLKGEIVKGKISIKTPKEELVFNVEILPTFPFSSYNQYSIRFTCSQISGYLHQNTDGSICLHSNISTSPENKLYLELEQLKAWIQKYYVEEEDDGRYEYLLLPNNCEKIMLFDGDNHGINIDKGACGTFHYSLLVNDSLFIAKDVANRKPKWSNFIYNLPNFEGIWIYVENEPVIERRNVVKTWKELQKYLTNNNLSLLMRKLIENREIERFTKYTVPFFLMIGYKIPDSDKFNIHWELISIDIDSFSMEFLNQSNMYRFDNHSFINWGRTYNISYDRFFGRGRLANRITEIKILIIGIGALGSSLAKMLVRGGVKDLTLTDFDHVEPGNVCRSEYYFYQTNSSKVDALSIELVRVSPFVDVKVINQIPKLPKWSSQYLTIKESLNDFDLIFDCSTDMEMALLLDEMKLSYKTLKLTITNKAKELICVTGSSLTKTQQTLYSHFESEPVLFYEGVGCAYPTFEASYVDVNTLLSLALKKINAQLEKGWSLTTFIVKTPCDSDNMPLGLTIDEY